MAEEFSTMRNIAACFFSSAVNHADSRAVGISGEDAYLDYRHLLRKVKECSAHLGKLASGQRVGLLAENRPEWGKAYLAILASGGIVVPIDALLKQNEFQNIIEQAGITKLIVSHSFIDTAEEINKSLEYKIEIIDLENIPESDVSDYQPNFVTDPHNTAVLIFTSGTTGNAKKVILTHENILSDIDSLLDIVNFQEGDRFLSVLPLHHTFEATLGFLIPLLNGCAVYYIRELNSREIMTGFQKNKITHFVSVPLIYEKLYQGILGAVKKAPPTKRALFSISRKATGAIYSLTGKNAGTQLFKSLRKKAGLENLKLFVSGGAPLPMEVNKGLNLLGIKLLEGYGLTETSPVLTCNRPDKIKFGTVGLPVKNVKIKIDQPDDNGVGEVLAKGPMITPGYQDNPEATEELFRDGWMCTGDLGSIDSEGFLTIKGRAKNLIVSAAGKNIYPEEIESELLNSEYILEAMVYAHQASNGREEVGAMIFPDLELIAGKINKKPEEVIEDDVKEVIQSEIRHICSKMAGYKRIKHITFTQEELQKTSTRKIKRYLY
ncbi:MAG: AMP-binding protein [candidate division Zixibacteria bacterium]|nr:AMP-binding protein [candidate division Zixibacteria bacterium]